MVSHGTGRVPRGFQLLLQKRDGRLVRRTINPDQLAEQIAGWVLVGPSRSTSSGSTVGWDVISDASEDAVSGSWSVTGPEVGSLSLGDIATLAQACGSGSGPLSPTRQSDSPPTEPGQAAGPSTTSLNHASEESAEGVYAASPAPPGPDPLQAAQAAEAGNPTQPGEQPASPGGWALGDVASSATSSCAPLQPEPVQPAVRVCGHCNKLNPTQRCSRCKTAWFCGAQCQRDAWPTHKRFCRAYDVERKEQELQRLYEDGVRNITRSGVRGALDQLQAAADLATRQKNRMYEGLCAKWIATCYDRLDDHAKAQAFAEQALLIARELKDWKLEAESLIGLGLVMRKQQPEGWRRALIYFEVALSAARRHADVEVEASALGNIGAIRMMEDRAEGMRALMECASIREDMLNAAVAQFRLTGDSGPTTAAFHNYTTSLINLGGAAYLQGDWDFAIELYEKALTHAETLSDVERQCTILVNLANMSEVQVGTSDSCSAAAQFRRKLFALMRDQLQRSVPDTCSVCLEPLHAEEASADDARLLLLACYHCFHKKCLDDWAGRNSERPACPDCKQGILPFTHG